MKNHKRDVITAIFLAEKAVDVGMDRNGKMLGAEHEQALQHLDKAMKLLSGTEYINGALRFDELDAACKAFLEEAGFPSLSTCLVYIRYWQKKDRERRAKQREKRR